MKCVACLRKTRRCPIWTELMTDWSKVPVFGRRSGAVVPVVRPSTYGLVADNRGRLALVRTSRGILLPGGGIKTGETAEAAVEREVAEECGLMVRLGAWTASAIQFVYSPKEQTHFEKRSIFFECLVEEFASSTADLDHELVWFDSQTAFGLLSQQSHRWAVNEWMSRTSQS